VKTIRDNSEKKTGFTIVELLTVMSIIILLISLLVPALNRVRRYAQTVKQRAQFHSIAVALDLFNAEYESYPDSNAFDDQGRPYCGAMKLAEAMVGQDLKGFNPKSRFRREGYPNLTPPPALWDGMPYPPIGTIGVTVDPPGYADNINSRKMHLQLENANAFQIRELYTAAGLATASPDCPTGYDPNSFVLCDIYTRVTNISTGKKMGMPILYYRAEPTKTAHTSNANDTLLNMNIYDVRDNQGLIDRGLPWATSFVHPMARAGIMDNGSSVASWPDLFFKMTLNPKIPGGGRPYREDSYILLSAGFDGEYGTSDDILNFGD
jgi:type II secretory pathway pseudopilin PulG